VIYGPIVTVCAVESVVRTSLLSTIALVLAGYVVWTLVEYWMHRVVFHWEPDHGIGAQLHWLIHGVHHEHPNDPKRLVMPPLASLPLAAAFALVFRAVLGADHWWGLTAGFLGGYLIYDSLHYALHHHTPTSRLGRRLRELHLRHHFQDDTRGFGISAPWWDVVFGTFPRTRRSRAREEADAR
jgi:dihydroceramide fatty acyl 2-hydroxylase